MQKQSLSDLFQQTEDAYGLPAGYLDQTADIESGYNARSYNELSGAKGIFQFISGTAKQYGLKNPWDVKQSTNAAARLAVDNQNALRDALGRDPTAGELYLAHQQGAAGAIKLLTNPNARAVDVLPARNITANGGNGRMSAGQFASKWTSRFSDVDKLGQAISSFNEPEPAKLFAQGSMPRSVDQKDYGTDQDPLMQRYMPAKGGVPIKSRDEKPQDWYGTDKDPLMSRYGQKGVEVEAKPVKTTKEPIVTSSTTPSKPVTPAADPVKDWFQRMVKEHPNIAAAGETAFNYGSTAAREIPGLRRQLGGNAGLFVAGGLGLEALIKGGKNKALSTLGGLSLAHKLGLDETALKVLKPIIELIK